MVLCSNIENIEGVMTKDEDDQIVNDASQIQLKYAKMLEELEDEEFENTPQDFKVTQHQNFAQGAF